MTDFVYRQGVLCAETVPLAAVAEAVGTPTYVYSSATIARNYRAYADAFAQNGLSGDHFAGEPLAIHYAVKANANLAVLALLASLGAGADIVSEGELRRALAAGIGAERIVFSGVGKTRAELTAALAAGVGQINVESEGELEVLSEVAASAGRRQPIALRVNPDVAADTHDKISTGKRGDKFGIPLDRVREVYARASRLPGLDPVGIAIHIGSQLTDLAPFAKAYAKVAELVTALRADGLAVGVLDLGGGLGVSYRDETPPPIADYARLVRESVGGLGCRLAIEPGRSLVGEAGVLLTRVLYRKSAGGHELAILDAGMNDLMRPSLYGAYHPALPVREPAPGALLEPIDLVGPVCESGDTFARGRPMPPVESGDLLAFAVAGAYGAAMASNYNARPLPAEIMVAGARWEVVRPRQDLNSLFAEERIPGWTGGLA